MVVDFMPPLDGAAQPGADRDRADARNGNVSYRICGALRLRGNRTVGSWGRRTALSTRSPFRSVWFSGPRPLCTERIRRNGRSTYQPQCRPIHSFCPLSRPFIRKSPGADRSLQVAKAHGSLLAPMERSVSARWAMDGGCQAVAHHVESFDLRTNGRNCCCCHDVASGELGRLEELGLPILLAARRYLHTLGLRTSRILRRSAGVARLADPGCRRQPTSGPDLCTGWAGSGGCRNWLSLGYVAMRILRLCGSGTRPLSNSRSMSSARSPTPCSRHSRPAWRHPTHQRALRTR